MPKARKKEIIQGQYLRWLLGTREGVYFADGRTNSPSVGRHSLSTRRRDKALADLKQLDLVMAVQCGLEKRSLLPSQMEQTLAFIEGRRLYEEHLRRPAISGGPRKSTIKRYRPVLDKSETYFHKMRLQFWNQVTRETLDGYAKWLESKSYAYSTQYLELNTLKQVLKFLVESKKLSADVLFDYPLRKAEGTETYCWHPDEVQAMFEHCDTDELRWLRHVLIALASTGLRISELASLLFTDLDLKGKMITLTDERSSRKKSKQNRRTTKSGHSRSLPIHSSLYDVLQTIEPTADGLVFHGPRGGKIKPNTVRNILVRDVLTPLAARFPSGPGEVGLVDGRPHSFRHYFCSICANSGIPELVLKNWLGHRSSKMIQRYYHLHDEQSQAQMREVQIY